MKLDWGVHIGHQRYQEMIPYPHRKTEVRPRKIEIVSWERRIRTGGGVLKSVVCWIRSQEVVFTKREDENMNSVEYF